MKYVAVLELEQVAVKEIWSTTIIIGVHALCSAPLR